MKGSPPPHRVDDKEGVALGIRFNLKESFVKLGMIWIDEGAYFYRS